MNDAPRELAAGDVVSNLEPTELVEVHAVRAFGGRTLVEGVGVQSRRLIRRPLSKDELSRLVRVRSASLTYDGNAEEFLLGAEAERIRIGHAHDPLFAVNASIVDPLPHQVEAVYRYLLPLPRIRFLLADDTGAGKTIMAGLLIKELIFRGVIQKVLVITPGGLTKQWAEEELLDKFGLHARLVNRATFDAEPSQFSRGDDGIFVTSIDFLARNEGCLKAAEQVPWDLIIVDEAHKLSAYEYGAKIEESARYKAVKALADKTDHLLFLTATPHRGRKDTFRRLLLLLDEDLFTKDEHVTDRVREQTEPYEGEEEFESERPITNARNRFFLRRLKENMVDWDNQPLFKKRFTTTVGYELTPEEKQLYDDVTKYVRSKRKEAKAKRNRNVELILMVMQRRLASSLFAITRTLEGRLRALTEALNILRDPTRSESEKRKLLGVADPSDPQNVAEYDDLSDDEREQVDRKLFRVVLTTDPAAVEAEREEVEGLFRLADSLRNHKEAKFAELLSVLDSSDVIRADDEKLVIFTEHRDTLTSLQKRLEEKGYSVTCIHGGMDVDARKEAQREFRRRAKIMLATDAAGEGINLQFCRFLVNWDIPWNPNRLEQRMGRIHRYGQQEDVKVFNLVAANTREGAVLQTILSKLDVMREQLGTDRVYDVIDEWLEGVPLLDLLEKSLDFDSARAAGKNAESALRHATEDKAAKLVKLQQKTSLASRLDLKAARDLRDASEERRLQPLFVQRFFERAWVACGGSIHKDDHFPVWHLGQTPLAMLDLARTCRVALSEHYETPVVFDKQLVSVASKTRVPDRTRLLGPGHVLFDTLIEWAIREARQAFAKGAIVVDPNLAVPQRVWLVRSKIHDGRVETRQRLAHERLAVIAADHMGLRVTSPSYFLNCLPPTEGVDAPAAPDHTNEQIQTWAFEQITEKQLEDVNAQRKEECDLRRNYLNTAFTDLIMELTGELNDLQHQSLYEDHDAEEAERLTRRIDDLKVRKVERMRELDLMLNLSAELPEVLTQAIVVPAPVVSIESDVEGGGMPMRRDDEVEAIAMDVAMRYERSRGWTPVDVSRDDEHYDVRSEGPDGEKRYIEVKGRAESGAIMLTEPELNKLAQLGARAWLYVVTACKSERPTLRIIQDPIPKLHPKMLYRQVQFLVEESDWLRVGNEPAPGGRT
ncbi:MAG: helicase-related protein [Planctomycetota bacterium]